MKDITIKELQKSIYLKEKINTKKYNRRSIFDIIEDN